MASKPSTAAPDPVREVLAHLPDAPGVYLMKGEHGAVLYVGKAKSLRNRVRSYFQKGQGHTPKTRILVRQIRGIETVVTASEVEALILENNLIKRHRPRYNVMLRDDKNYPYIRLSVQEPFPRLSVVRRTRNDGARYYGPYVGAGAMRQTLRLIHRHFPLADCDIVIDGTADRPCLQYQIGRCKAPCTGFQTQADYARTVREVRLFLEGRDRELVARLNARMRDAAEAEVFERAAALRDCVRQIEQTLTRQRITTPGAGEVDVIGLARAGGWASLQVLFVRDGSLIGTKAFVWEDLSGVPDAELYAAFIKQFYDGGVPVPGRIVLPAAPPEATALAEWLSGLRGKACRLESPARGRGLALLHLAGANAETSLAERLDAEKAGERGLVALQKTLRLGRMPARIEGLDISHIQGELTVASLVVWEGSGPRKADYRHFRIRSTVGPDDFLAMAEAVTRRYRRVLDENLDMPDLVVIDGGRGQLSAALRALKDLKMPSEAMPEVVALAKERGERFERVFKPGLKEPTVLKPGAPATRILQQIRDEAHRFAVTYHRKLRSLRIQDSLLDTVPGVGRTRKRALLTAFGSIEGLRNASAAEVAAVPGIPSKVARRVWEAVRG